MASLLRFDLATRRNSGASPTDLAISSGYGGYYALCVVGVHTGTSADFTSTASNCIAQLYAHTGKSYFVYGPSDDATASEDVYFNFEPKYLQPGYTPKINVHSNYDDASDIHAVTFNVPRSGNTGDWKRYMNQDVVYGIDSTGQNAATFDFLKDNGLSVRRLAKKSDMLNFIPIYDGSTSPIVYGAVTNSLASDTHPYSWESDNQYQASCHKGDGWRNDMDTCAFYHRLFAPTVPFSTTTGVTTACTDKFFSGTTAYGIGKLPLNSYTTTPGVFTPTVISPGGTSYSRVNNYMYDWVVQFSGFQCWRYLQLLFVYASDIFAAKQVGGSLSNNSAIYSYAIYSFSGREPVSGTTGTTNLYCASAATSNIRLGMRTNRTGEAAHLYVFARRSSATTQYYTEDWVLKAQSAITSMGPLTTYFSTLILNFAESYKDFSINSTYFNVSNVPVGANKTITVRVTYTFTWRTTTTTAYSQVTTAVTNPSSMILAQFKINLDKTFSLLQRWCHGTVKIASVKYIWGTGTPTTSVTIQSTGTRNTSEGGSESFSLCGKVEYS